MEETPQEEEETPGGGGDTTGGGGGGGGDTRRRRRRKRRQQEEEVRTMFLPASAPSCSPFTQRRSSAVRKESELPPGEGEGEGEGWEGRAPLFPLFLL